MIKKKFEIIDMKLKINLVEIGLSRIYEHLKKNKKNKKLFIISKFGIKM